jgi:perosamine synthetase
MVNYKIPMSKPDFGDEERQALLEVFDSGWLSQGKITKQFEDDLGEYVSSNCVVVNNGSSALICTLLAHGIKPGDKIAVPAFTFIATATSAKILGAEIIPVDIDPNTMNMSLDELEKITKCHEIKAVIVVDVGGLPIDIDMFSDLAKRYNFILIEDAAESLGSEYKKKKIGSFEHVSIFSFHIAKPITTIEGGCIASKNDEIIKKIKQIKDHGRTSHERYIHDVLGTNFRITDLQSALGIQQLKKIEQFIEGRNNVALRFRQEIKNIQFQEIPDFVSKHAYMLFFGIVESENKKNEILKKCIKNGIDCRNSWMPLTNQLCFPELKNDKCPNAEKIFRQSFTIPIYNSISNTDVDYIINTINE